MNFFFWGGEGGTLTVSAQGFFSFFLSVFFSFFLSFFLSCYHGERANEMCITILLPLLLQQQLLMMTMIIILTSASLCAWSLQALHTKPFTFGSTWKCIVFVLHRLWLLSTSADLQKRIQAMEMRCNRKILRISYKDHITNEEVRAKIQQAIGPHEDLLTIVKRHKLQWYGHVSRSSGLAKTILQGTVKGGRRRGRQRKRWEENFREWTGLEFAKS